MINEVSRPMSHHVPVEKICEKLKKKDSQICELKYGEEEELVRCRSCCWAPRLPLGPRAAAGPQGCWGLGFLSFCPE